ncbi:hypothetical protein vseg_015480 [Gypsophila vaccaria]
MEETKTWYGNMEYLMNISAIGAVSCVIIFLVVKLRSDHRRIPGPAKLLAVWHASARDIAVHCGADSSQFLVIEGGTFALLSSVSVLALLGLLPLNLYGSGSGSATDTTTTTTTDDLFSTTTISHIPSGSPLLWCHLFFSFALVLFVHKSISLIQEWLRVTRFRDSLGNPSPFDPSSTSSALFTLMLHGLPNHLAPDPSPLVDYFEHKYPSKLFRLILPMDLCHLDDLVDDLLRVNHHLSNLVDSQPLSHQGTLFHLLRLPFCCTPDSKLRRLHLLRADLLSQLSSYKDGTAPGAGVAFLVFKDVYTANRALQDFKMDTRLRFGTFFSLTDLQLHRNQWKIERAPLASDIYWTHLGSSKLSLKLRRVFVNSLLLLMLLFFSSPLAAISALQRAARIINAEAMDNAQSWLSWLQSSSWFAAIFLQFLPNVLVFVSMYILIPAALSYLSKFERHITVSGEQRAALIKMVCFFLVNLIVLRGLVESSLESTILSMGRCYLDGEDCRRIEQYMSASFLSKSCLSSLAFLITCTFLGISFDLLAPIPWIKRILHKFRKNDMLQLVPEDDTDTDTLDSLRRPLISEEAFDTQGHDLAVYPVTTTSPIPKQNFDFAQYYAFNLTIFALTMIYSSFAPLVVPVGAIYFGYRYMVDKYNFLFVYRVRGFPAGNDGKLMDTVLSIMRFCVDLYLLAMLLFFSIHGDPMKLQAIFTLGLLVMYKLLPSGSDVSQPAILQGMQTIDHVVEGPIDYEVFSQPKFEWDRLYS